MILTPMDSKRFENQNPHLLCLMQVWPLTGCERFGVLVMDALEHEEHTHLMHHQGSMVGGPPLVLEK